MAGYIGPVPTPQATQTRDYFTATAGQTSFPTSGYTPGYLDVYLNGVHLQDSDYTATDGSDVVLNDPCAADDVVLVVAWTTFEAMNVRYENIVGSPFPDQTGSAGKFLTTDGTNASWQTVDLTQFDAPVQFKNYTTAERNALTGLTSGDTIYNSTTGSIEFYDGTNWIATNLIPTVNSVSGTIYEGAASTITVSMTNATDAVTVRFSKNGIVLSDIADASVVSGEVSVSVPAEVYAQTAGDVIAVSTLNQDGTPSSNAINKTMITAPSGGSILTTGNYRVHQFTSSSNFVVPSGVTLTDVEYLVIGGGGAAGYNGGGGDNSAGGGAGGYRCSVPGELSGRNSTAETPLTLTAGTYTVTVGAGGTGANVTGPSATLHGSDSSFAGITSIGGGGESDSGGSGGGRRGTSSTNGSLSGTAGQGFDGGEKSSGGGGGGIFAGGGGGAGEAGNTDGIAMGGDGLASAITGGTIFRAGGGAGGYDAAVRSGGAGGGGNNNGTGGSGNGGNGQANTGSGGGGCRHTSNGGTGATGGSGGSGIVIVRYQL